MDEYKSLNHTQWECLYHVVFIPKCRRRTLYVELRRHLGEVFRRLAKQKESQVEEGHLMIDHVHMMLRVPPKYAVSQVVGFIKGRSAIHLAGVCAERKRSFVTGRRNVSEGVIASTSNLHLSTHCILSDHMGHRASRAMASRQRRTTRNVQADVD